TPTYFILLQNAERERKKEMTPKIEKNTQFVYVRGYLYWYACTCICSARHDLYSRNG
uniref:Uncharacterized protein n=1 Tax=Triticum urartu TaxID=4572 RepID=A0A8R7JZ02_TRIUA